MWAHIMATIPYHLWSGGVRPVTGIQPDVTHQAHKFTAVMAVNMAIQHDMMWHCIVSTQLWTGIYHIWPGPLTLRWWPHSIYVAQSPTIHSSLALTHHYSSQSIQFASIHPICFCPSRTHIIGSFPQSWVDIYMSYGPGPICGPYHCRERCGIK